jgi:peptide deformylase
MYETMEQADGVGLAAPQIGKSIRFFVIDATKMEDEEVADFKQIFINPEIIEETGDEWAFEEGCLSIPEIREDVMRPPDLTIKYLDENWEEKQETYSGMKARIIQHEYDHIEGVLFTDHISAFKKRLLKSKLQSISKGKVQPHYRIKAPLKK